MQCPKTRLYNNAGDQEEAKDHQVCCRNKVASKYRMNTKFEYRKRDSYYQDMEDRIKRMESAIIASGLQGPAGLVDVKEEKEEEEQEEKTSSDMIESQAKLSNQFANLVINSNGSSNFIGMPCL